MTDHIKVIDLFAGPGGLGEGFSALQDQTGNYPFQIAASIEKEKSAHRTLTLRAFYRQFRGRDIPDEYYDYLRSDGKISAEDFFAEKFPAEWFVAKRETLGDPKALGSEDHEEIFSAIEKSLEGHAGPKIVIGGPPCQAYSLAGRARNKGIKDYSAEKDHRHFLYLEYLKVLDLVQPDIFVMENVKGILTAKVNGESIFQKIRKDLICPARTLESGREEIEYDLIPLAHPIDNRNPEGQYRDKDFVIRAEEFGIPQTRHRVILLGVRKEKLKISRSNGALLEPWRKDCRITPKQVLNDLPKLRSGLTRTNNNCYQAWYNTLLKGYLKSLDGFKNAPEAKAYALDSFARAGKEVNQGGRYVSFTNTNLEGMPPYLRKWYTDNRVMGALNHHARNHMPEDLYRYFFASCFARTNEGVSPRPKDYPDELAPAHKNWKSGKFVDRFKVQAEKRVASTVTSHISKDGHYFIHYDPAQCRSLTVREAARIQTFPDNYFFEGNKTEQYVQVGNAVPPLLANHIARVVIKLLYSLS